MDVAEMSVAQKVALLSPSARAEVLEGMDLEALQYDWKFWSRPAQYIDMSVTQSRILFLGGRGAGKTRGGCEWTRDKAKTMPGSRGLLVARTAADVRDVLVNGEALALDTLVATPDGFKEMREIEVGDYVLGADGLPARVTWCSDIAVGRPCYLVTLKDGTAFVADEKHKWLTAYIVRYRDGSRPSLIRTTGELARIVGEGHAQNRVWIDAADPLELPEAELPIPPYTLGAWLGDGHTHHAAITAMDQEILDGITADGFRVRKWPSARDGGKALTWGILGLSVLLKEHDLLRDKHVPDAYLRASHRQRLALLQGLIDTDGTVSASGQVEFSNTNLGMVQSVRELCATLGIKSNFKMKRTKKAAHHKDIYRLTFMTNGLSVATVARKRTRIRLRSLMPGDTRHFIKSVVPVESVPVKCIAVDNEDHMYLIGRTLVPTHNSGILNIHPPSEMPTWEPSKRLLTWPNNSTALVYSAEIPDALRGIQSHWSLADEIGTWDSTPDSSGLTAWDNLILATRLGETPQVLAMTTPRRTRVIKELLAQAEADPSKVLVRRSRTADNRGNLSVAYLDAVVAIYEGTSLAAQELDGQMLDDVEGALWASELLDAHRLTALPADLFKPFVIIGVDPSVAENPRDEAGIVVVVGTAHPRLADRHAYVMEDASLHGSPAEWAERVAQAARKWGAPVIAEINQGGALIKNALTGVDPSIRVVPVHARVGKALRAEPVVLASQQGRLHMVGEHTMLEDQLTTWQPELSKKSPDRLDAMVYACLAVFTEESKLVGSSPLRITSRARARASSRLSAGRIPGAVARNSRNEQLQALPPHMRRSVSSVRWSQ